MYLVLEEVQEIISISLTGQIVIQKLEELKMIQVMSLITQLLTIDLKKMLLQYQMLLLVLNN